MEIVLTSLSPAAWALLLTSALVIGMSKTWLQVLSLLAIPLMAAAFGARASTGVILPMLCFADVFAAFSYRKDVDWRCIFGGVPFALVGFGLALVVDKAVPPHAFRQLMGACLAVVLAITVLSKRLNLAGRAAGRWWYGAVWNVLGGFTTMIGNAAGPVLAVYMLSMNMPKYRFVATSAYFFLVLNLLKLPVQVLAWDNITAGTLVLNLCSVPLIIVGGLLGRIVTKRLPEGGFQRAAVWLTAVAVVMLLLP